MAVANLQTGQEDLIVELAGVALYLSSIPVHPKGRLGDVGAAEDVRGVMREFGTHHGRDALEGERDVVLPAPTLALCNVTAEMWTCHIMSRNLDWSLAWLSMYLD